MYSKFLYMQLYCVKLDVINVAEKNQNVNGYLGYVDKDGFGEIGHYNRQWAKKMCDRFGGSIEPIGKNYMATPMQILTLSKKNLFPETIEYLEMNKAFADTSDMGEFFCYGSVFEDILTKFVYPTKISLELKHLAYIANVYSYIHIVG